MITNDKWNFRKSSSSWRVKWPLCNRTLVYHVAPVQRSFVLDLNSRRKFPNECVLAHPVLQDFKAYWLIWTAHPVQRLIPSHSSSIVTWQQLVLQEHKAYWPAQPVQPKTDDASGLDCRTATRYPIQSFRLCSNEVEKLHGKFSSITSYHLFNSIYSIQFIQFNLFNSINWIPETRPFFHRTADKYNSSYSE